MSAPLFERLGFESICDMATSWAVGIFVFGIAIVIIGFILLGSFLVFRDAIKSMGIMLTAFWTLVSIIVAKPIVRFLEWGWK